MKIRPKRAVAVAAAVVVGLGAVIAGGTAQAATASNYAHSTATTGHRSSFDVEFQVRQMYSDSINAFNEANAMSVSCTGCRSVAIAFQIVADAHPATVVNAGNHASAVNVMCTGCQTLGIAYQFILAKPTRFDSHDRAQLDQIEVKLEHLRWSHDPVDTVAGKVEALAGDVAGILAHADSSHWPLVHRHVTEDH
jgi:hypothetical protein